MDFDRDKLKSTLAALAAQGAFVGTSSWKYPGWLGQLYTRDRYVWRGRYAESRFERNCLAEYAEVFKTVCVDAAYYVFPKRDALAAMAAQVPADFQFAFKVTDEITLKQFPNLPRFGHRAGQANGNFLNADLFTSAFLTPCEAIRPNVGLLMFEFTQFHGSDFARGREFVAALDEFLGRLPRGWAYAVEIRNRNFLQPEYFAALARHAWHTFSTVGRTCRHVGEQIDALRAHRNAQEIHRELRQTPQRAWDQARKEKRSVLRPAPRCPWWDYVWSVRTALKVGSAGRVPIGTQRLRIERPPATKVVLCLHPAGHYSVLAASPDPKQTPALLFTNRPKATFLF